MCIIFFKIVKAKSGPGKNLLETFPLIFAEASPKDHLWGIGLDDNPQIYCRKTWRGKNWLGFILTNVRNEIMDEYGMFLSE